jgi:hypothetical protein
MPSPKDTHGPIVKTGPTSGKNRSRKDSGQWRSKRSDSGKPRKSGCFVSTAACRHRGLPDDCYELQTLRKFRDDVLLASPEGRQMVEHYYRVAPGIADRLVDTTELERTWLVVIACVKAIERNDYPSAIALYRETIAALQKRLGLQVA